MLPQFLSLKISTSAPCNHELPMPPDWSRPQPEKDKIDGVMINQLMEKGFSVIEMLTHSTVLRSLAHGTQ